MAKYDSTLSRELLLSQLRYELESGKFFWLRQSGNSHRAKMINSRYAGKEAGRLLQNGYINIKINRVRHLAHRLAWLYVHNKWPPEDVDHINGVRDDNRISNLRLASRSQNLMNVGQLANNTSGVKGVHLHRPSGKYLARIRANGQRLYLGSFSDLDEAAKVVERARRELHGKFAPA